MHVYIRPHAIDNGLDDYQVVVKPNYPPRGLNKFGILDKTEAEEYASTIAAQIGAEVVDET